MTTLPPIGCLPAAITVFGSDSNECVARLNHDAVSFNTKLNATSLRLQKKLSGLNLVVFDIYQTLFDLVTKPTDNGTWIPFFESWASVPHLKPNSVNIIILFKIHNSLINHWLLINNISLINHKFVIVLEFRKNIHSLFLKLVQKLIKCKFGNAVSNYTFSKYNFSKLKYLFI